MKAKLEIQDLHVSIDGKEILKGVDLVVGQGEIHALMGPNGAGKSTLANALMGHPSFAVTQGCILFKGQELNGMGPDERARLANFLRMAINARRKAANPEDGGISVPEFRTLLKAKMDSLQISHEFAGRFLNEGFSGGEKKRAEILQLATLEPEIAILDETDSGLDIDALKIVAAGVKALAGENLGVLIITHYQRILNYVKPHHVHILLDGRIVQSGGPDLAEHLEEMGYDWIREQSREPVIEG